jgi:aspartate ammonia-lyase
MTESFRIEKDSLGEKRLPNNVYYGVQTERARENFPISGLKLPASLIRAVALIKLAAVTVHQRSGEMEPGKAGAIKQAASEVLHGKFDDQFVVDAYQAGAGTSFHMNANEVIANRAIEILGGRLGNYSRVHPNDDVNMGQSTNDVFPTAMRLACLLILPALETALDSLSNTLKSKSQAFSTIIKSGRTHLQDAVPITLGQEFGGYASSVERALERLQAVKRDLLLLGIGGTAVGTGLNTRPDYRKEIVDALKELTGLPLASAPDLFFAMQSLAPFGDLSGALRSLALELIRIANDFRLLASGPRTGFNELKLPAVQPGSSIMPGKVNPSMAEMLNQVCFQVLGNDTAIAYAIQAGQLELNVMMPVVAHNVLGSISLLTNAINAFEERCARGLEANREACEAYAMRSLGLATALNPLIGYLAAAEVVHQAVAEGRSIPEVVVERGLMNAEEAAHAFSPQALTRPRAD